MSKILGVHTSGAVIGQVAPMSTATVPLNYLLCDGTAMSRTVYAALFASIGVTHGSGDGSTTFNIPDYRGKFLRGVDGTAAVDPDKTSRTAMNTGGNTGNLIGSIQGQATKKNGLTMTDPGHVHSIVANASNGGAGTAAIYSSVAAATYTNTTGIQSGSTGITLNTGDNETRPLNAYVNYIIAYK